MKIVRELLGLVKGVLEKEGIAPPQLEAEKLLAYVLGLSRVELYCDFDRPVVEKEVESLRKAVKRRLAKEPFAYIEGVAPFYGLELAVNTSVLIPRPETELLVEKALSLAPLHAKILDLCTGSGAIAVAMKKRRPDLEVIASDISIAALDVARKNGVKYDLEIRFEAGDLLAPFEGERFDLIVVNPPYVSEGEWSQLEEEVRLWEPKEALVGGVSGLEFYERLCKELPRCLHSKSHLLLEIGHSQSSSLQKLFENSPFVITETIIDYHQIPRHLSLKFKENFCIL